MGNRMLELAIFVLVCAIPASPQSATPSEAIALEQQGKLEEAARVWRAVIKRDPNDAGAFASLGVVLSRQQGPALEDASTAACDSTLSKMGQ